LPVIALGSSHKVNKLTVVCQYNLDDYGKTVAEATGVGKTVEDLEKSQQSTSDDHVFNRYVNDWIMAKLDWKASKTEEKIVPITIDKDIHSKTMGCEIKAGLVIGTRAIVTSYAENGSIVETINIG
jgi:hypothetical protein